MAAPVIHVQPSTQTVYEGQTCKFRVVAGGTSLSYQWQKSDDSGSNWSDISGATSSSYTTAATVRSTDNGDQYRCNVTSGGDTTTSDAATMTVWNPTALGSNYAWFRPEDCYTERTGASATTAVTDGDPCGTWRDQTGTINGTCSADTNRPTYRATGINNTPSIQFDGTDDWFNFTTDLASFFQNKSFGYVFAGVMPNSDSTERGLIGFSGGTGTTRLALTFNTSTAGNLGASGRRLDANSFAGLTKTSAFIDDEPFSCGAEFLWSSSDLHVRKNKSRAASSTSFQSDGATSNTASTAVAFGAFATGASGFFNGHVSHIVLVAPGSALSSDDIGHIESFIEWKMNGDVPDWNYGTRSTGALSVATLDTPVRVVTPNGSTVTEADIATHRYHHQNAIAFWNGRVHVAYTSSGTNEDAGGQMIGYSYSDDTMVTWSSPAILIAAQSTFDPSGSPFPTSAYICNVMGWVQHEGRLFFCFSADEYDNPSTNVLSQTGVFAGAREILSDGSFGTPFRISEDDYTALDGKTKLDYDSTLGPILLPIAARFAKAGGSAPGYPASDWGGYEEQSSVVYYESRATYRSSSDYEPMWKTLRDFTNSTTIAYFARSEDHGVTYGDVSKTNVPNGWSPLHFMRLTNGKYALLGNFDTNRTELWVAILDSTLTMESARYIKTGVSTTPVYAGTYKTGGAAYADAIQVGNYLYCSWSERKEDIWSAKVLITGLSDTDNDLDSIEVTSPALDDTLTVDTEYDIDGTQSGTSGNVDILLSIDGGLTFPITLASNATLPYSWTPTFGHVASSCVLRVRDTADTNVFGDSLGFSVQAAPSSGGGAVNMLLLGVG